MLRSLKHRGPDSTGFAVYGANTPGDYVMRFVLAEQEDMSKGFDMKKIVEERLELVEERLAEHGAEVKHRESATDYAKRFTGKRAPHQMCWPPALPFTGA